MARRNSSLSRGQGLSTVRWAVDSQRTQLNIPTEGKSLMAVGGVLVVFGAFVWLTTGK